MKPPGSIAIDHIPAADCVDADGEPLTTDQRGEPRPGFNPTPQTQDLRAVDRHSPAKPGAVAGTADAATWPRVVIRRGG